MTKEDDDAPSKAFNLSELMDLVQFYDWLKLAGVHLSSPQAIYALTHARKIRHVRIRRRLYFTKECGEEYIKSIPVEVVEPIKPPSGRGPRFTIPNLIGRKDEPKVDEVKAQEGDPGSAPIDQGKPSDDTPSHDGGGDE